MARNARHDETTNPVNVMCWDGGGGQLGDGVVGGTNESIVATHVVGAPFDVIFGERGGSFEEP